MQNPHQEGISEMNATSTENVVVEAGGDQVVADVGLHALGRFADRLGVGAALSEAIGWEGPGRPVHDRGRVLVQSMLMLTGGGDSCADIETLVSQDRLFGRVCSDSTLYRTFTTSLSSEALVRARRAVARVRAEAWRRLPQLTAGGPVILDVDASLVEVHSENKQHAAATYKRGFGFHPMLCFADATGETLTAKLRAGNASANHPADLLATIDEAISQLPDEVAAGHHLDDDADLVAMPIVVRSDSAGVSAAFVTGLRARNCGFQIVAVRKQAVSAAVQAAITDPARWQPALKPDGQPDLDATSDGRTPAVCDVTDLVDLASWWPQGTRLIIRRQPLHPGAQTSLFPDLDYRYWGHYTDQAGDPAELDRQMRGHARCEDRIQRLKDSGMERFPFTSFDANQAWLQTVAWASDLVVWFQHLCLTGPLASARPKRLRYQLWRTPARIIRTARRDVIRILDHWPTAGDVLAAYQRIAAFT